MNATPILAWPHNLRHLLSEGHDRQIYDTQQLLPCYRNQGLYPVRTAVDAVPPFRALSNRQSRRANGQRGDGYGQYFEPRISPRAAKWRPGQRASVEARQKMRAPGRVAAVLRGQPLSTEERATGRYLVANDAQAGLLADLMRALG